MSDDDLASLYREMDADKKRRKAERVEKNLKVLRESTLQFEYKKGIQTVLVRDPGVPKVDFYASVDQWKEIPSGRIVFGDAEALLAHLWRKSKTKVGLKQTC